ASSTSTMLRLTTRPQAIEIAAAQSAVVVVDMQNACVSKGGLLDIAGIDVGSAGAIVRTIAAVLDRARCCSILVVHLQMGYKPDQSNSGGPHSPKFYKKNAMKPLNTPNALKRKQLARSNQGF